MSLLPEGERNNIKKIPDEQLQDEVNLIIFTQETECEYCKETKRILDELSQVNSKIKVESYDLSRDQNKAMEYNIEKVPATILSGKNRNAKIRFFGLPAGHGFSTMLEDTMDISKGVSRLSPSTKENIKQITKQIHIQIFVTLTCPYCPSAVRFTHQIALENDLVTANMTEAVEYPQLAQKYNVT